MAMPVTTRLSSQAIQTVLQMRDDFAFYAPRVLRIKTKSGTIEPLKFNSAQAYINAKIEEQKALIGKVRVLILKGRQQGVSTYTEARFYWLTSMRPGMQAYILTHEQKATDNLFGMATRYYDLSPDEVKPTTSRANAKELAFSVLQSGYKVATAGAKGTGRSGTAQLFHGSEVAFWPNAEDHMAGLGQAIPDLPGTEVILESTANGVGNLFHQLWCDAVAGRSDFIAIFVPWFWQEEYRRVAGEDFALDDDEREYAETYGLDNDQMAWRRAKLTTDFKNDVGLFDQEYPATPALAFRRSSGEPFIKPAAVERSRKAVFEARGAKVMGLDPAEAGDDSTAVIFRTGRVVSKPITWHEDDTMTTVGKAALLIEQEDPDAVFVDRVGIGAGVCDRLCELFPTRRIIGVKSGEAAIQKETYINRRAEMWGNLRDAIEDGLQLPDDEALAAEISAPGYGYDSARRYKLELKEKMRERGVKSPDRADALALTYAFPVTAREQPMESWRKRLKAQTRRSRSAMAA